MSTKSEWTKSNYENLIIPLKNQKKFNIPKSDYQNEGKYPIVSQEKSFISGYTDDKNKVFNIKNDNYILFGDHTTIFKYLNFDFVVGADGAKIFKSKNEKIIKTKYLYYISINNLIQSTGYNRHFKTLKEIEVIFPNCIKEQDKIVEILDQQQSLIDSYKEKLSLLEEQESYYQDELLSGRIRIKLNSENEKVAIDKGFIVNGELVEGKEKEFEKWLSVDFKDKVDFYKGNNTKWNHISNKKLFIKEKKSKIKVKEVTNTGEYPFFNCSETLSKTHNEYINDGEFLLFSTGGKAAVHYYNGKLSYSSDIYCVSINNKILPYYAYLYWNKNTDIIWKYFEGTGLKHLKKILFEKEEVFYPENKIEQIFIISVFETVFKQKKLIKEKIKIEEEKMDYLMDELLSGRIRVE